MNERSNGLLEQRLDRLEERGRAVLTAAARGAAWREAAGAAARASIAIPVLALIVALVRPVPVVMTILSAILVPLLWAAVVFGRHMARHRVARREALALVDRSLALKDRSVIAAEFLASGAPDGFRQAALQEAAPWLDRATSTPVERVDGPQNRSANRWVLPLVASALLVLVLMMPPHGAPGGAGGEGRSPLARVAMALGIRPSGRDDADPRDADGDRPGAGTGATGSAAGTRGRPGTGSAAQAGPTGEAGRAGSAMGDAPARPSSRAGEGSGSSPSSMTGGAADANGSARTGGEDRPSSRDPRDGRQDAEKGSGADAASSAGETRATPPRGAQSGAAATSSPAGSPPPHAPGSDQDQQGSGSRRRQPQGEQSQGSGSSGRASNNGQQGSNRGNGQEGIKRARGSSSLLLAVPMEDRVIGTVNAGTVSSTTREAPPRAMAAGRVAAQSRGSGQGPAAHLPQRARSVQEDRLLEAYFRRNGVER